MLAEIATVNLGKLKKFGLGSISVLLRLCLSAGFAVVKRCNDPTFPTLKIRLFRLTGVGERRDDRDMEKMIGNSKSNPLRKDANHKVANIWR